MENPEVLVATAGEALMDLVQRPDGLLDCCEGGAVYNFSRALALQAVGTSYLNRLSADGFGRKLARGLRAAGVALAQEGPVAAPTSLAVVGVDPAGQPRYSFYRQGVADRVDSAAELIAAAQSWPALRLACTGCLALAPEEGSRYLDWLGASRNRRLAVVIDANLRPSAAPDLPAYRRHVREALALADVIKASDEDLAVLLPDECDAPTAARSLFSLGDARWVALTLGARGALLLARDGRVWHARDRSPLAVVDTVGAGDCFLAGLVAGALSPQGWDESLAPQALARAVASASHCVQQRGCAPPTASQVRDYVAAGSVAVSAGRN